MGRGIDGHPGFGGLEEAPEGLRIPAFADQDDIPRPAEGIPHGLTEFLQVVRNLRLRDRRDPVRDPVQVELDRGLVGEEAAGPGSGTVGQGRCQAGRLAGSDRPRKQHQAVQRKEGGKDPGLEFHVVQSRRHPRNAPERQFDPASPGGPALRRVHPEPVPDEPVNRGLVGVVHRMAGPNLGAGRRMTGGLVQQLGNFRRHERTPGSGHPLSVKGEPDPIARFQDHVGRLELHRPHEERIQLPDMKDRRFAFQKGDRTAGGAEGGGRHRGLPWSRRVP